jgi:hypothetical protein
MVTPTEIATRARLGIPANAERVLIFAESSHWDTNWLKTSEGYFSQHVEPILLAVLRELDRDARRVYCVESLFFLVRFWERHPDLHQRLREVMDQGRLRLVGASFTTPDTLLPHVESILREYHLGHSWLRERGLPPGPATAYFPDNFGHTPHLPTLMREVGVNAVAVTRIDGMFFVGTDFRLRRAYPLPGSTAETLSKKHHTLDFIWRDDSGAEVLCHWNAFTYFQGEMLAHAGVTRWAGHVAGFSWRTVSHTERRVASYVRQLQPLALTPYMLCPIGMDFNDPIADLRDLLERYNRARYAKTGIWTLLAGYDDYFELIGFHRARLPTLQADPNPYWMGFYASRPELKQRATRIAKTILLAEKAAAAAPVTAGTQATLRDAWMHLVPVNHHDCITGTSPDSVWNEEQRPWLDEAEAAAEKALAAVEPPAASSLASTPAGSRIQVTRATDAVRVETPRLQFTVSLARGGCITSLVSQGVELLDGPGFDLVAFDDEGGLWRLGNEFRGGKFAEVARSSEHPATVEVMERDQEIVITIMTSLDGCDCIRSLTCRADEPALHLRVQGRAGRRRTVTCRSGFASMPAKLFMDTVGGSIERPRERHYRPTFWPVPSHAWFEARSTVHALFEAPTAVSAGPSSVEWIVFRNATRERAFRMIPVLAHPIGGTDDGIQTHASALCVGVEEPEMADLRGRVESSWVPPSHRAANREIVRCSHPGARILATKNADRGEGLIVRLFFEAIPSNPVRIGLVERALRSAWRSNALESDLETLSVEAGEVSVAVNSHLLTLRLQ